MVEGWGEVNRAMFGGEVLVESLVFRTKIEAAVRVCRKIPRLNEKDLVIPLLRRHV